MNLLTQPWPWYVSGPLIGLMVPTLLVLGNKAFGISSSLRHMCAAALPTKATYFRYDWKAESWNLLFVLGILTGGLFAGYFFKNPDPIRISEHTVTDLNTLGVKSFTGFLPEDIFNFRALLTLRGLVLMVGGGFLIGFGTRYANGCTSGHAITGLSNLQLPSLIATCCFFGAGILTTWFLLPLIFRL
jgi:uncharacterized membrane protein YedE/YeeE